MPINSIRETCNVTHRIWNYHISRIDDSRLVKKAKREEVAKLTPIGALVGQRRDGLTGSGTIVIEQGRVLTR